MIVGALPVTLLNGTTADATDVMADLDKIRDDVNLNAAANGANNDITSLTGMTTPLSVAQGGTAAATAVNARVNLGVGDQFFVTADMSGASHDVPLTSYSQYRAIKILLQGVIPATDNVIFDLRYSTDGGSTWISSGYNFACLSIPDNTGTLVAQSSGSTTIIPLTGAGGVDGIGNGAAEGVSCEIILYAPTSSTKWPRVTWSGYYISSTATPAGVFFSGGGSNETAQNVDGVQFFFSSGNISSGNCTIYGLL